MKNLVAAVVSAIAIICVGCLSPARASSNFTTGHFTEYDPAGTTYHDLGICQFFTGPRAGLPSGRFLMKIGDRHSADYGELKIVGDVSTVTSGLTGDVEYRLFPDDPSVVKFFQTVLREQLRDPRVTFELAGFTARVGEVYGAASENHFVCRVRLTGSLHGMPAGPIPISLSFEGAGQLIPGIDKATTTAAAKQAADPCPTDSLAPDGLDPLPDNGQCPPASDCLVNFKGYKWWTSFNFRGQSFPDKSYYWNNDLGSAFAPKNAFVDGAGLHLTIQNQDLGAGPVPAAAEVVAMFNAADGSEANLGYGKYLVTATIPARTWDTLDLNAAFGVFTFERVGTGGGTGTVNNPNREIDLAEISRWGWPAGDPQCLQSANPLLCKGNAQFALQLWDADKDNVNRYSIAPGVDTITLVMTWSGANQPVLFQQYNGAFNLNNLPATPDNQWKTAASQNRFVPATACQRFHMNLWMGNFRQGGTHPPPQTMPYEVIVTNFQFAPL